jgi:hypothetical protein
MDAVHAEYQAHLLEHRECCVAAMDVDGVEAAKDRISAHAVRQAKELRRCVKDCFQDVVYATLARFNQDMVEIEDNYDEKAAVIRKDVARRFQELQDTEHIRALTEIETRHQVELVAERRRPTDLRVEYEGRIKRLLEQGEYDAAKSQKKKMENEEKN